MRSRSTDLHGGASAALLSAGIDGTMRWQRAQRNRLTHRVAAAATGCGDGCSARRVAKRKRAATGCPPGCKCAAIPGLPAGRIQRGNRPGPDWRGPVRGAHARRGSGFSGFIARSAGRPHLGRHVPRNRACVPRTARAASGALAHACGVMRITLRCLHQPFSVAPGSRARCRRDRARLPPRDNRLPPAVRAPRHPGHGRARAAANRRRADAEAPA